MMSLVPASRAGPAEGPFLLAAVRDPEEPVRAFLGSEMWALGDGDPWSSWHDAVAWCCWRSLCQAGLNGRERETDRQRDRRERDGESSLMTSSQDPVITKMLPLLNGEGSHSVHGNRRDFCDGQREPYSLRTRTFGSDCVPTRRPLGCVCGRGRISEPPPPLDQTLVRREDGAGPPLGGF